MKRAKEYKRYQMNVVYTKNQIKGSIYPTKEQIAALTVQALIKTFKSKVDETA